MNSHPTTDDLSDAPACFHTLSNLLTIVCCAAEELSHHNPGHRDLGVIACAGREAIDVLERCRSAVQQPGAGNVAGSVAATTRDNTASTATLQGVK
ncbi:MAG TPA: hypothetical protein VIX73_31120 [Kofleriaceae bacterium]|jgi:hypothetical protein